MAEDFCDGLAIVKIDGETHHIDRNGVFRDDTSISQPIPTLEMESGYASSYELHDGLVRFVENQKFGFKDKDGNIIIKPQFFEATDFCEGLACVKRSKSSLWGYIDTKGRNVIPARFHQAKPFHEGLAAVLIAVD